MILARTGTIRGKMVDTICIPNYDPDLSDLGDQFCGLV